MDMNVQHGHGCEIRAWMCDDMDVQLDMDELDMHHGHGDGHAACPCRWTCCMSMSFLFPIPFPCGKNLLGSAPYFTVFIVPARICSTI
jgi:hypothetical protein